MQDQVGIQLTDELKAKLQEVLQCKELESDAQTASFPSALERGFLTSSELRTLVKLNKKLSLSPVRSALQHASLVFPGHPAKSEEVSLQLAKRREYLRMRQEERSYNSMMYGSDSNPHVQDVLTQGNQFNAMKTQLTTSFNMVFTVFATCGMAYFLAVQIGFTHTQGLMVALVAAIVMMLLEMVLFILRATQMETHFERAPAQSAVKTTVAKMRAGALITPADAAPQR